jgi:hypothetical protein
MAVTAEEVSTLVEAQLMQVTEARAAALIRSLLVTPRCEQRVWDYGEPGTRYPCWIVLEHTPSGTGVAYSEHGFGPKYPWGLLFISREQTMGMDSAWYDSLENAVRDSMAWPDVPEPE